MKITLRLIGTRKAAPFVSHLELTSGVGKTTADQQTVFEHVGKHSRVRGLAYELKGDGSIIYSSPNAQITPGVVADMKAVFEEALRQI